MAFDESKPIFLQLAEQLEAAILNGVYAEGDQVPSITEYAIACKINPATALKGVNLLVDSGLLYKKRGIGMFVTAGARDKLQEQRRKGFYEQRIVPTVQEAQALGLNETQVKNMIERGFANGDRNQAGQQTIR